MAIPGAQDIEIDQHEFRISRFFLQRDITTHTNVLELTARLIVTLHHDRYVTRILWMGCRKGNSAITFLSSVQGNHRHELWQTCSSGGRSWDLRMAWKWYLCIVERTRKLGSTLTNPSVGGTAVFGRKMPYYMSKYGVSQLRPHEKDGARIPAPEARKHIRKDIERGVIRDRKVGLTTNNQTGATLTSVAVVIRQRESEYALRT